MIVTFIPAAGRSTRMQGRDKLLEAVDGQPILRRTASIALSAGLGPVLVGLKTGDQVHDKALRNLEVEVVPVPDADEGMAATLRAGARAALREIEAGYLTAGDYEYFGMMVLLPDMPDIAAQDLIALDLEFQANGGAVVRAATEDGRLGHPTIIPDYLLRSFDVLEGDRGASALFEGEPLVAVDLGGQRARTDLDTPEDWKAWRQGKP